MAVGSQFSAYINPLLTVLRALGGSARSSEVKAAVATHMRLSDAVLDDRLASGSSRFDNQVSWARYYLVQSGYIDSSRRGVWTLTEKGRNAHELSPAEVTALVQTVVADWRAGRSEEDDAPAAIAVEVPLPENPPTDHRTALLDLIQHLPPAGFERLCQRLLREAGFEEVVVTGRSGDGGIDGAGLLQINPFVTFRVLFQCKKYAGSVGPSAIRDFRGAMDGRADKGIILTTGSFSSESKREAIRDGARPIELVDGEKLLDLFEQLELGLSARTTFDVNHVFFDEFRR